MGSLATFQLLPVHSLQRKAETRADWLCPFGPNPAAVRLDDRTRNRQTHAHTGALGRDEGLKQPIRDFGIDARPIVGHADLRHVPVRFNADFKFSGRTVERSQRIHAIAHEIKHHLLDLNPVDKHEIDGGIECKMDANAVLLCANKREGACLFDELRQAFDAALGLPTRNEVAQTPNDVTGAEGLDRRALDRFGNALVRDDVALKQHPHFNASLSADGASLVLKQYFHIGVAVDTPNGLVVPVIRDVDKKGLLELARELGEVSERVRAGKISPADLQGGCFSISSLGGLGGGHFSPIINAPEVAILGVGRSAMKPVWSGKEFTPRLMLPLSISYDHRVIDGAQGARFIAFLSSVLSDIRRLVL